MWSFGKTGWGTNSPVKLLVAEVQESDASKAAFRTIRPLPPYIVDLTGDVAALQEADITAELATIAT